MSELKHPETDIDGMQKILVGVMLKDDEMLEQGREQYQSYLRDKAEKARAEAQEEKREKLVQLFYSIQLPSGSNISGIGNKHIEMLNRAEVFADEWLGVGAVLPKPEEQ